MQDETDLFSYQTYSAIDFVIGLFITLGASLINALGLNITKLDYTRQDLLPASQRKPDYTRLFWWIGLILYVASQLVGSTFALSFLRAEYVAPLGSTSLIFNFIFAYLLVGTPVTRTDIIGTCIIVLGVIGVVIFGNNRTDSDFDKESNLSLSLLKEIWGRKEWIIYLVFLLAFIAGSFWFSTIVNEVCMGRIEDDRSTSSGGGGGGSRDREDSGVEGMLDGGGGRRTTGDGTGIVGKFKVLVKDFKIKHGIFRRFVKRKVEGFAQSRADVTLRKSAGLFWAITGGTLAGLSLILAKSAVKLVTSAIKRSDPNESNQFTSPLSWLIIILLVIAAVTQVYCLNASLKCYDSTFTVPIFFATYTASGFCNSLIYLDEFKTYKLWVFLCIWLSIGVLVIGVALLSFKKPVVRIRSTSISRNEDDEEEIIGGPEGGESRMSTDGIDSEFKKGQGFLSKFIPEDNNSSSSSSKKNPGELGRKARRNQKGVQRLDDTDDADSVLNSERSEAGAEELEMDNLDYGRSAIDEGGEEDDDKVFDAEDFGDFKDGEIEEGPFGDDHESRRNEEESKYSRV